MKYLFIAAAAAALVCGCASEPEAPAQSAAKPAGCRDDANTGTHIVRRSDCARLAGDTAVEKDKARELQEFQNQTINQQRSLR